MEIGRLHLERPDRRTESFEPDERHKKIRRIGFERSGLDRAYCAFITEDGTVTYEGHGKGLEGTAQGKVNIGNLYGILQFLGAVDIDTFADDYYHSGVEWLFSSWALDTAYLLVETQTFTKTIHFHDGIAPPQLRLVVDMFDLLLDCATWNKNGFFIQRDLSVKPPIKRKWG